MFGIKSFKEELYHLRTMIESMTKSSRSYTLPMKGKSTFNTIGPVSQADWILDSRASDHMTPFPILFNLYLKMTKEQLIIVANGDIIPICESGNITLEASIF